MNILSAICSDYALAHVLEIAKRVIDIIRIFVPIFLIFGGTITFVKYVFDIENKKLLKNFISAIEGAVLVFLLPFIINVLMAMINSYGEVGLRENGSNVAFQISSCWSDAGISQSAMNSSNAKTSASISSEAKSR